ncbi:MAG TPA: hypothetical protein VHN14_00055 [Kofleriaceae bacterium]|nr:hypothetical protein [Kofleriaceae bacterium]
MHADEETLHDHAIVEIACSTPGRAQVAPRARVSGSQFSAGRSSHPDPLAHLARRRDAWLDAEHFAVGRWDGSLSVFRFNPGTSAGPLISTTASSPSSEGVQMITWLSPRTFASSNAAGSMIVWRPEHGSTWAGLRQAAVLRYDASFGESQQRRCLRAGTHLYLVAGHANGYLTIWSGTPQGHDFHLVRSVDMRSAHSVNPWNCTTSGAYP